MKVSIKTNLKPVEDEIKKRVNRAREPTIRQMLLDTTPFVPVRTGKLRKSGRVTNDGIVWDEKYALDVYLSTKKYEVGTRQWFEAAKLIYLNRWVNTFQKEVNK